VQAIQQRQNKLKSWRQILGYRVEEKEFKPGARVRVRNLLENPFYYRQGIRDGDEGTIVGRYGSGGSWDIKFDNGTMFNNGILYIALYPQNLELI
jgi:hypothetical protein